MNTTSTAATGKPVQKPSRIPLGVITVTAGTGTDAKTRFPEKEKLLDEIRTITDQRDTLADSLKKANKIIADLQTDKERNDSTERAKKPAMLQAREKEPDNWTPPKVPLHFNNRSDFHQSLPSNNYNDFFMMMYLMIFLCAMNPLSFLFIPFMIPFMRGGGV